MLISHYFLMKTYFYVTSKYMQVIYIIITMRHIIFFLFFNNYFKIYFRQKKKFVTIISILKIQKYFCKLFIFFHMFFITLCTKNLNEIFTINYQQCHFSILFYYSDILLMYYVLIITLFLLYIIQVMLKSTFNKTLSVVMQI